jgi:peptidyl carrier protein
MTERQDTVMEQKILSLIIDNYGLGLEDSLNVDTPLLELNIIDSSAFFDLIELLQAEFTIKVPLTAIKPENFASVRAIAAMTCNLQAMTIA